MERSFKNSEINWVSVGLMEQSTHHPLVTQKNTHLFSHGSGGQKSAIKVPAELCSPSELLVVASNPGCSLACGSITPVSASVITWWSVFCIQVPTCRTCECDLLGNRIFADVIQFSEVTLK